MAFEHDVKGAAIFIAIAFALTYSIALSLYLLGGLRVWFASIVMVGVMFVPTIAVILVLKLVTHESLRALGVRWGPKRYYAYAYALPSISVVLGLLVVAVFRTASISTKGLMRLFEMMPPEIRHLAPVISLASLAIAPFINSVPALGEEYGWRGFLLTKLTKYGLFTALLVTGVVWGLWHAPFILMGYNFPHHPDLVGVSVFTAWCVLWGVLLGWLRLKSGSVLPAALGHGALNAHVGLGLLLAPADELITVPLGWPALTALLILAFLAYLDLRKTSTHLKGTKAPIASFLFWLRIVSWNRKRCT